MKHQSAMRMMEGGLLSVNRNNGGNLAGRWTSKMAQEILGRVTKFWGRAIKGHRYLATCSVPAQDYRKLAYLRYLMDDSATERYEGGRIEAGNGRLVCGVMAAHFACIRSEKEWVKLKIGVLRYLRFRIYCVQHQRFPLMPMYVR
jgi:hypothetical protein